MVLEFLKSRFNQGKLSNLFYYRDQSQREVDIVQEHADKLYAYEIKSAKAFHRDFLKYLMYLKKLLGSNLVSTQVIYDGETDIDSPEYGMMNFRNAVHVS